MRYFRQGSEWCWWESCGVSDELVRSCAVCNKKIDWDFTIKDSVWKKVVPKSLRQNVICLTCLCKMAEKKEIDISQNMERVQFTGGKNFTIEFVPSNIFVY